MLRRNIVARNVSDKKRQGIIITIFLVLYIFSMYAIKTTFLLGLSSLVMYVFVGLTILKLVTRQTPLLFSNYIVWYFVFGIVGFISSLYAINDGYVVIAAYVALVSWIVSFSFTQYSQNYFAIKRILITFAYSPTVLIVYLLLSGNIFTEERLGQTALGNANILASYMMISLFCILWLIVYSEKKIIFIHILLAVAYFSVIFLTGGRKSSLIPFIFFFLLLVFKNWSKSKPIGSISFLLFGITIFASANAVMNIPELYFKIGIRFEELFSFVQGNTTYIDYSAMTRLDMITTGWNWFLERPLLGYGLNNFTILYGMTNTYAHNNFIELLVDLGAIGFTVYYIFYIYLIIKLIKIRNDHSGLRNFFLAFMLSILIFEIGMVTYNLALVQIFISLGSVFILLYNRRYSKIAR